MATPRAQTQVPKPCGRRCASVGWRPDRWRSGSGNRDSVTSDVVIAELYELSDLRELEGLFTDIWERPGEPPVNADLLRALAHSGNYVVGARVGSRLVGGLVGWLGGLPAHELHMHSHILGVAAD